MSIRTDLIDAKLSGNLEKIAIDMLSKQVKSYADFCDVCDILEKEAFFGLDKLDDASKALAGLVGLGGAAAIGGSYLLNKSKLKTSLQAILNDPQFPDHNKVNEIFRTISKFAPVTMSNPDYAKLVMVQFYNSPMVTPDMVSKIVSIENSVKGEGGAHDIPGLDRITKTIKGMRGNQ